MEGTAATAGPRSYPLWAKVLAGILAIAALLALLLVFFPWDWLRGPLNRYVSEKTGRHFEITSDTADPRNIPNIGALVVDQGSAHFVAAHHGADIQTEFAIDGALTPPAGGSGAATTPSGTPATSATPPPSAEPMPLRFQSRGTWQKEPFTAQGRTGNVLHLSAPLLSPFPLAVNATAGSTTLRANGTIASLATLEGANADFNLQGRDLADLYKLVGVVLPATPRYLLRGKLSKQGEVWQVREIDGKLGNSDLTGELSFDRARKVPPMCDMRPHASRMSSSCRWTGWRFMCGCAADCCGSIP